MIEAIVLEMEQRKGYLVGQVVETFYLGGGTPSLLDTREIKHLLAAAQSRFTFASDVEFTLEANPDDLNLEKLEALAEAGVNRLSIGVQSFFDADLRLMNRAHQATEALHCIQQAQQVGFQNISIDLIYGSPSTTADMWQQNLDTAFRLEVPHLSAYCLTVEPRTALAHLVQKGKYPPVDEEKAHRQFQTLVQQTQAQGFEHYEISNFALPGQYSRHNTSYWQGQAYLGLGPAAHSYDGHARRWNIAHNPKYIQALQTQSGDYYEQETLSPANRYNEYVMTTLRTQWGIDPAAVSAPFRDYLNARVQPFLVRQQILERDGRYVLADAAKFLADGIAADLFWIEEG